MEISSDKFDYDAPAQTFTAERSDLGPGFALEQVYPDACDVGFTMVSARSGNRVKFVETSRDMNGEDLQGQWFEPTKDAVKRFPKVRGTSVLIIND